jgi:23S rRNA (cytosine1962-C5)-methyltransferase
MPSTSGYGLIDFGGGARLERFGDRVVDRPAPGALGPRGAGDAWRTADLRFDRDRGWSGPASTEGPWSFEHGSLRLELRPTETGQVGVFPEHLDMLEWLRACVERRAADGRRPAVLHLFAYTGLATLAMADAGAEVTHVDAAKPTVAWARHNAELSGLADRPVRWIVDDAVGFTEREARRGRTYAGIVLDPPTYGHGPGARPWRLEEDLPRLLAACDRILERDGFALLTAHTPGYDADRLARLVNDLRRPTMGDIEAGDLAVATPDGRSLELGAFTRAAGGA